MCSMSNVFHCLVFFALISLTTSKSFSSQNDAFLSQNKQVQTNSAIMSPPQWPGKEAAEQTQDDVAASPAESGERNLLGAAVLLYLQCEVSGQPVKAFVDTGAQATVMSEQCAKRCGLLGRIDARFAGRAVGVGSARILGRIHSATLRIGTLKVKCEINVLQNADMDLLIGLDVLRAYKCEIDLRKNSIRFNVGRGKYEDISFTSPKVTLDSKTSNAECEKKYSTCYGDHNDNNNSQDFTLSGW